MCIEGASLKEMEARKLAVVQQLNTVLTARQGDGFQARAAAARCRPAARPPNPSLAPPRGL